MGARRLPLAPICALVQNSHHDFPPAVQSCPYSIESCSIPSYYRPIWLQFPAQLKAEYHAGCLGARRSEQIALAVILVPDEVPLSEPLQPSRRLSARRA